MLLENDTFAGFVDKPLAPTKKTVSCIVAITYDSEDEVRAGIPIASNLADGHLFSAVPN